jgi:hypothetical protein
LIVNGKVELMVTPVRYVFALNAFAIIPVTFLFCPPCVAMSGITIEVAVVSGGDIPDT